LRLGSAVPDIATRTAAGSSSATALDALAQVASMTGNIPASSSAVANDGRSAVDTTMIGPCWDIRALAEELRKKTRIEREILVCRP
jgi:hypothetical protein